MAQVFQLAVGQPCLCPSCDLCALTSSQVSRRRQVRKVIQADDVDDGADHARMVLHREREEGQALPRRRSNAAEERLLSRRTEVRR